MSQRYPLKSNHRVIKSAVVRAKSSIKKNFVGDYGFFRKRLAAWSVKDSKETYSMNGVYNKSRNQLHKKVVNKIVNKAGTVDRKDPDVYFFGGMPASGKTTALRKRVKEKVVVADADLVKEELAKKNPSGFSNYVLANAPFLHRESSDVNKQVIAKSMRERRDIIIDGTARNEETTLQRVKDFKAAGYDVHFLGTQKKTEQGVRDAAGRFLVNGRYVPPDYVGEVGDRINRNVWVGARSPNLYDSAVVVDTSDGRGDVVYSRGSISKDSRSPK